MEKTESYLYKIVLGIIFLLIILGFIEGGFTSTIRNLWTLQMRPARLISDFTAFEGTGATLVNSGLVGIIALFLIRLTKVRLAGPTIAALFTMMGFAFFGKTPLNILPIIAGVYIAAKFVKKKFAAYLLIALFGTALAPLISFVIFQSGLQGIVAVLTGITSGLLIGCILPSIAIALLHLHQGYILYNVGFSCGFLGLFIASIFVASGINIDLAIVWSTEFSLILILIVPVLSVLFITFGFILGGKDSFTDFLSIQNIPGRLPSDFIDLKSVGGTFLNMGFLGICGAGYVFLVKGNFNGPVIGALFTLVGFGAFGKTLKNCWPIIAGVVLGSLIFGKNLADPGPLLAAIFATTLAPLAGTFGPILGIVAGFIHLLIVERTAAWHGGFALYNNGFAAGLTATLLVAVIEWIKTNKDNKG